MTLRSLREAAYEANLAVQRHGLVIFTWGNASARDAGRGLMAIKPSGVPYAELAPRHMVLVDLATGKSVERAALKPSSDAPTHAVLYRAFPAVGGIVHTHSRRATAWAQAGRDLPCLGTTHADYFDGPVPCTPPLTRAQIHGPPGYEIHTGEAIVREFRRRRLEPDAMPAVLVHGHAPFVWGGDAAAAVHHAVVLEEVAGMAFETLALHPRARGLSAALLEKHFHRKHGPDAYYGQAGPAATGH